MSEAGTVATLERAAAHEYPALGNILSGQMAWLLAAQRFNEASLREVNAELDKIEQRAERERDEAERREAARHHEAVARGEEELTDEEQAEVNQVRIELLANHQRYEDERPRRVEALLERVAAALERR